MLCWTVGGKTKKITAQEVSGVTRKFDKEAGTTDVKQQQQQQIYFSHFAY